MYLNCKKVSFIPPLSHQNKYLIDFKEKVDIFNHFFSELRSLINYSSKLPFKRTAKVFSSMFLFITNAIATINCNLDPNRFHGHEMMSIRMLKICEDSISKHFKSCIGKCRFPDEWKIRFQFIKYVISKCRETTDLFHCFQYVEQHLEF